MRFTIRELLILMLVVAILFALVVPAINSAREAARKMQCNNNLKQYMLSIHNYESTTRRLPCAMGGTEGPPLVSNAGSISGFIGLMPYVESSPWYNELMSGNIPGGTAPWIAPSTTFDMWELQYPSLLCPSDDSRPYRTPGEYGHTNYAFCWGDGVASILDVPPGAPLTRGPFQAHAYKKFSQVRDGLSHTVAIGEIVLKTANPRLSAVAIVLGIEKDPSLCSGQYGPRGFAKGTQFVSSRERRGGRWCDGRPYYSGFTTILPPNSLSCAPTDDDASWGVFSTSSNHRGGAQVAMLDGTVREISNNIDCGILSALPPDAAQRAEEKMPSPYGVWGAMGTIDSSDGIAPPE